MRLYLMKRLMVAPLLLCISLYTVAQTGLDCVNYGTTSPWNAEAWNFTNMKHNKVSFTNDPSKWFGGNRFKGLLEYTPPGYNFTDKDTKYPLIVFFHGNASRGDGSLTQLCRLFKDMGSDLATHKSLPGRVERETELLSQADSTGTTYTYIVASPQFHTYNRVYPENTPNVYPSADAVDSVLDYLINVRYQGKIDASRIYLTGYSNGANMVIEYAGSSVERAKRLAAIMPVALCSDLGHYSNAGITAENVGKAKLKTWFVYCKDDVCGNNVPLEWVNAIKAVPGAVTPRLTTLTDPVPNKNELYNCSDTLEHDAWSRAFDPNFKASFTGDGTGTGSSVNDGINQNVYEWFTHSARAVAPPPVTVNNFQARVKGGKVELEWEADDENNNAHYIIERRGLTNDFQPIGKLPTLNERAGERYTFVDDAPLADVSYYRVAHVGVDGETSYFDTRKIINLAGNLSVVVSPNPFVSDVSAYIKLNKAQKVSITLTDMTGKVIRNTSSVYGSGNSEIKLAASDLPKGVYILKVTGENINSTTRIIKR